MKKRTLLSWSSGKDSAWALYTLLRNPDIEVAGLFTVINEQYNRVSMHATRLELLKLQAEMVELPLEIIKIPDQCSNEQCDAVMAQFITEQKKYGIGYMAYGDLFLEDIREYREKQLRGTGIQPIFPLWKIPTMELAKIMLSKGLQAYISSVDLAKLPDNLAGQEWTMELLETLPAQCDPCGENGEIHTIVTGGPMFKNTIQVHIGEIVKRSGFAYADIIPDKSTMI